MNTAFQKSKTWISSAHQGFVQGKMAPNTLSAYYLAALKGADMIETDARTTKDGVIVVNHDAEVKGYNDKGEPVRYVISETDAASVTRVILAPEDPNGTQYLPTLEQVLNLAYYTGMRINIDLKEGLAHAEDVAKLVTAFGMRGRTVYATNGAGATAIHKILRIDPAAQFIDTVGNYTAENLCSVPDYPAKCFAYTHDFSAENIARVRRSGCMLAAISLTEENALAAFVHHPDMAEYPHTSDFSAIDKMLIEKMSVPDIKSKGESQ